MTARERLRTLLLRGEVDHVEGGTEHLLSMRERRAERERQAVTLRAGAATERHSGLRAAARRRFGLLTK